jgi:hypothetical protein
MVGDLMTTTSRGGNYLINIGPDADGRWPPSAEAWLDGMTAWFAANGEAIAGAEPTFPHEALAQPPEARNVLFTARRGPGGESVVYAMVPEGGVALSGARPARAFAGRLLLESFRPDVLADGGAGFLGAELLGVPGAVKAAIGEDGLTLDASELLTGPGGRPEAVRAGAVFKLRFRAAAQV